MDTNTTQTEDTPAPPARRRKPTWYFWTFLSVQVYFIVFLFLARSMDELGPVSTAFTLFMWAVVDVIVSSGLYLIHRIVVKRGL